MHDVALGLARAGHDMTVLAINTPKHHQADPLVLGPTVRLLTEDVDTSITLWGAARGFFNRHVPYNVARFVSPRFRQRLMALLQAEKFDLIQLEGTFMAPYVEDIRRHAPATPVVLRAHNLECQIWERLAAGERNPVKRWYLQHLARGLRRFESGIAGCFDAIAAITELDRQQWAALAGDGIRTVAIPAGVDRTRFRANPAIQPKARTVGIIGSLNWQPNLEGLRWLLSEVWPRVRERLPDLELHVAGSSPPDWLQHLKVPGVVVRGFVPSAPDFLQQHPVLLVPLLSGGGMRIKIIEAMTLGRCVLTTTVGGEGIEAVNGRDWLVADTPQAWVDALVRCFGPGADLSPLEIGHAAALQAARHYDNIVVTRLFEALYAQLIAAARPPVPSSTRARA